MSDQEYDVPHGYLPLDESQLKAVAAHIREGFMREVDEKIDSRFAKLSGGEGAPAILKIAEPSSRNEAGNQDLKSRVDALTTELTAL